MPNCILQVTLANDARDFACLSLNDLPLLDHANSNDAKLRKSLGRVAAQAERKGAVVSFFVCDEAGGRPHDVIAEPVSERDLRTNAGLKGDLELIRHRLAAIEPEVLRKTMTRHFDEICQMGTAHQACHFFKWRTPGGSWRLVWCWGFQRKDLEPAPPMICTNPACKSLFVKRSEDPCCPTCKGRPEVVARKETAPPPRRRVGLLAGVAFLALALVSGLGYWIGREGITRPGLVPPQPGSALPTLAVTPSDWSGPAGGRVEFTVVRRTPEGKEEDVTRSVIARSDNQRVARFSRQGASALARAPGKSVLRFHLGDEVAQATMHVEPPRNPKSLTLQPAMVSLGLGATERLRLIGEYEGGAKVDLTESAQWAPAENRNVFVHRGMLEGVAAGEATVRAMYRATPDQPWLDASSRVSVQDEQYESIKLELERGELPTGQTSGLRVVAISKSGRQHSLIGSSQLALEVQPAHVARLDGDLVVATSPGSAKLVAAFQGRAAETAFAVTAMDPASLIDELPKSLELSVGEIVELDLGTASDERAALVSSAPDIVEVQGGQRLVGRAPGKAVVVVPLEDRKWEIDVDVRREVFQSLAIVPEFVSLAMDESTPIRVIGRVEDGAEVDIAPDRVRAERLPSPSVVDCDLSRLALRGVQPTAGAPQTLVLRVGELRAECKIDVAAAPVRLSITPAGPLSLPVGQMVRLQVWGNYGDGRRIEIAPDQLEWKLAPEAPNGLEFNPTTAVAQAKAVSPTALSVVAIHQGGSSPPVQITAVEPKPMMLVIAADGGPLVVGEKGRLRARLIGGDYGESAAEQAEFASADASKLAVDRHTGAFSALAPGEVTIIARHPLVAEKARQSFQIVERSEGRLELRPQVARIPVGGRVAFQLVLVSAAGERAVPLTGEEGVRLAGVNPAAVRWESPSLVGVGPTRGPFEFSAAWQHLSATSIVEVLDVDAAQATELRVTPSEVELAPGQPFSPRVEQRIAMSNDWVEVSPGLVEWSGPVTEVVWTRSVDSLPNSFTLTDSAPPEVALTARYHGGSATLTARRKSVDEVPKPSDPNAKLSVERQPAGETLAVGRQQRYVVMVEQGGRREPAAGNVQWQPAFANDFVEWKPPTLIARRAGHVQRLTAVVAGRHIDLETRIVGEESPPAPEPPVPDAKPKRVRIENATSDSVRIPLGGDLTAFHVWAEFDNGGAREVTTRANLFLNGSPPNPVVAVSAGRIAALRAGRAEVFAEYLGVRSETGLAVEVTESTGERAFEILPSTLSLAVGETAKLRAVAVDGSNRSDREVGDVSLVSGMGWESKNPDILQTSGPTLTALKPGRATVVARLGNVTATADVTIVMDGDDLSSGLEVAPRALRLRVGEAKALGVDMKLTRGKVDFSRDADVVSSRPSIVRVDKESGSVVAESPGEADLAFTYGGQNAVVAVVVEPNRNPSQTSRVVIEPSAGDLAVGESRQIRVFTINERGERVDRTGSAALSSSDDQVLAVAGTQVTARGSGQATLQARVPEAEAPGTAAYSVREESFTELEVTPAEIKLVAGEQRRLLIQGVGPAGRRDIADHPALSIAVEGGNPGVVEFAEGAVRALSPGKASLNIRLKSLSRAVAVEVVDASWSDLRVEPAEATIAVGETQAFLIFGKRGGKERSLTPADGVVVRLGNESVGQLESPFSLRGESPGFSSLSIRLGDLRADAKVTVTASDRPEPPVAPPILPAGLRFIPDVLRLQLGTPGASVRVVKVGADGQEEDVDNRTNMKFDGPSDVADMKWTASGPVFKPLKLGATRVTADFEGMNTQGPLIVEVVDQPDDARLEVRPNPLSLKVGETASFQRARIVLGRGRAPIDARVKVESADEKIAVVGEDNGIRGAAPGEMTVKVVPVGVDRRFEKLSTNVAVRVVAGDGSGGGEEGKQPELVLAGPSRTTVNATVNFRIELVAPSGTREVTSEGAALVLDRDQESLATVSSGGALLAKKPGTVNVKARYKDLVSAPVQLRIDPLAVEFAEVMLEIETKPLTLGETRPYKVWGVPRGGGARQDLTNSVRDDNSNIKPRIHLVPATGVLEHQSPAVVGKAAGTAELEVQIDQGMRVVRGKRVKLEVVAEEEPAGTTYKVEPSSISVRVGEAAPTIRVFAHRPGETAPRQVDASFQSADPEVLESSEGGFVGRKSGQTRLISSVGGVAVTATVMGHPFQQVKRAVKLESNDQLLVTIDILGATSSETEYRILMPGGTQAGEWVKAVDGRVSFVTKLARQPEGTRYQVDLESRGPEGRERYPCTFKVIIVTEE